MDELEQFSALIGHIYEAAAAPDKWRDFGAAYVGLFPGTRAVVQVYDRQNLTVNVGRGNGYDPAFIQSFVDHYQHFNPFLSAHATRQENSIARIESLLPPSVFEKTEYFNDWWKPQSLKTGYNALLFQRPDRFMVFDVTDESGTLAQEQLRYMQLLMPHMQRAAQISRLIAGPRFDKHILLETLDRLAVGVLLLDNRKHLIHANRMARKYCSGDGLCISASGRLVAQAAADRALLDLALDRMANSNAKATPDAGATLAIRRQDKPPLSLLLSCLPGYTTLFEAFKATILIFVKAPEDRPMKIADRLAHRYGFTPAEARLLDALAAGTTLAEYAEARRLSVNTAKVQLRALLAKTDTRRQTELMLWLNAQATHFAALEEDGT